MKMGFDDCDVASGSWMLCMQYPTDLMTANHLRFCLHPHLRSDCR